jgi:predicted transcriptional regulator
MTTVTIGIASIKETQARMQRALDGKPQGAVISFPSVDRLWKGMTPKRWERLRVLTGVDSISIRDAARRVGRDVKTMHGDVIALLNAGVLQRSEQGSIPFPYDAIHVDFMVKAA